MQQDNWGSVKLHVPHAALPLAADACTCPHWMLCPMCAAASFGSATTFITFATFASDAAIATRRECCPPPPCWRYPRGTPHLLPQRAHLSAT